MAEGRTQVLCLAEDTVSAVENTGSLELIPHSFVILLSSSEYKSAKVFPVV